MAWKGQSRELFIMALRLTDDLAKDWPLPDSFMIELGRISALWGSLEGLLNLCIGKLAGFDNLGDPTPFILVTHSSFPQRLDMLGTLCEQLAPHAKNLERYPAVISQLREAQKLRNRFMHNGISFEPESRRYVIAEASARGKLKTAVKAITREEVRAVAEKIHLATQALYELILQRQVPPRWEQRSS